MLADLEESLGTTESASAVYDAMIELRVATPQMILNYASMLRVRALCVRARVHACIVRACVHCVCVRACVCVSVGGAWRYCSLRPRPHHAYTHSHTHTCSHHTHAHAHVAPSGEGPL
jgi:hypothetical protein